MRSLLLCNKLLYLVSWLTKIEPDSNVLFWMLYHKAQEKAMNETRKGSEDTMEVNTSQQVTADSNWSHCCWDPPSNPIELAAEQSQSDIHHQPHLP